VTEVAAQAPEASDDGAAEAFAQAMRVVEALLFASAQPLPAEELARSVPAGVAIEEVLARLTAFYDARGVNLRAVAGGYAFRTAPDLGYLLAAEAEPPRKLSRAALEVLAIIAYHQPVTRAEIEEIRGVATAKGTLDILLEAGWVRLRGRRRSPGAAGDLRHDARFPRSFRARPDRRPARARGAEGLRLHRGTPHA
jgi:segregation and condensation protein B